ncbi:hypothetical protein QFZ53_003442 [Microbacterium natoriense]|uniref:Transcriptional regulator, AbiEi antitoxin, Type IV TA system n=2 Tax=Microbacterium natoriense TaxID=284570 RepID=A0AAW8F439_9MICO|nr:hypothetical protein [Microbacterium natoriense]
MRRMNGTTAPTLEHLVRSRADLLLNGWTDRRIANAIRGGAFHQIRRGWFIAADERKALWEEEKHRVHVIAVARDSRGPGVMSHSSAAVLWRLPLWGMRLTRVHMTTDAPHRISSSPDVHRHVAALGPDDVNVIDGIRCTSLARTVFDLIRVVPVEAAVAVADAAERQMAARGWEWDLDAVTSWRGGMQERLDAAPSARGIRQARWVSDFADGRAQLPGESVSRLQLFRLGFEPPELQVPVDGPGGSRYFVDFGLKGIRVFGEFDGQGKYRDEALRSGKPLEQVLLEEKRREDWIRGTTQWRFARWEAPHIQTARALESRLASFGIAAP